MKKPRPTPEVSTASLPDIIFMLLFFFMVVTVLRKDVSKLFHELPTTNYAQKIEQSKQSAYVYIGYSTSSAKSVSVQINDRYVDQSKMDEAFERLVSHPKIDKSTFEISLKADRYVPMKVIRAVKISMQKAGIKHLFYMSERKEAA